MKAVLRCIVPRSLPIRAASTVHARSANTPVAACPSHPLHGLSTLTPSVRASGHGRGPRLETDNVEEDINAAKNVAPQRPPSPRHHIPPMRERSESSSSSNVAFGILDAAIVPQQRVQEAGKQTRAYRNLTIEAARKEHFEPLQHWLGLAQLVGVPLSAEVFNCIAVMYVSLGRLDVADSLCEVMQSHNIQPNTQNCARMIRAWGRRRNIAAVDEWMTRARLAGVLQSDEVQHACLLAWGDCGEVERVFAWAQARSAPTPNPIKRAFLVALGKNGKTEEFEDFCHGMFTSWSEEGEAPAIPRLLSLDIASAVIRYHPDSKVADNVFNSTQSRVAHASVRGGQWAREDAADVMGAMMSRCLSKGRIEEACDIFDTCLRLGLPTTSSTCAGTAQICATAGNAEDAEAVWADMLHNGILPDADIFLAALQEFGGRKNITAVDRWVERATSQGFDKHPDVQRAFIGAWAKCGHPERLLQWARSRQQ